MPHEGQVVSINISVEKGTIKQPVSQAVLDMGGIAGDAHAGRWHRQVSLLSQSRIDDFAAEIGRSIQPGEFAENITVQGLDLTKAGIFDRLTIGDAELEVTQIGKACHGSQCAIFREVGRCVMPREGIFCKVISGGPIKSGDQITLLKKTLRFLIITLSDRAHRGDYQDRSGPRTRQVLETFLAGTRWDSEIECKILPDDPARLTQCLSEAKETGVHAIFTTGGTGIGPRDHTPDTVRSFCDKSIPGIMEFIRLKYGQNNPRALLSRSEAGIAGQTLVYAIPGSVKGAEEYMNEIVVTLEHLIYMAHGLDIH